jgi:hypothetical protein
VGWQERFAVLWKIIEKIFVMGVWKDKKIEI